MDRKNVLLLLCVLLLSACGSTGNDSAGLMPLPSPTRDPSDAQAMNLLKHYIAQQKGPAYSRYDYTRADLNGDGAREAIFLFKGPYNYWCGWSGCMMVIMEAANDSFRIINEVTGIRGPLLISENTTNGWRDIIVRVSGTNMPDRNVAMKYDGDRYPVNPFTQTDIGIRMANIPGTRIFP